MAEQAATTITKKEKKTDDGFVWAVGRRKTAIARVRMSVGEGPMTINDKELEVYYPHSLHRARLLAPLTHTDRLASFTISIHVTGGGPMSQADAISHALARALQTYDLTLRPSLKQEGFLTRDPRMKERKKYGLKRARKAPQFSKR